MNGIEVLSQTKLNFKAQVPERFKNKLMELLPNNIETILVSFEQIGTDGFCCELRICLRTKEEAISWLHSFQSNSFTTYNVDKTYEESTLKTVFKRIYHCLHNTRPSAHHTKVPHPKHTNCAAKLMINIKQSGMKNKDVYLKKYPGLICIRFDHNDAIFSADAIRHRKPSEEIEEKIKNLFSKGHSPSSALQTFKIELQKQYKDEYYTIVGDGSKCPTRKWCYDLYYKVFQNEYGDPSGPQMIESLNTFVQNYNKECGESCAIMNAEPDNLVAAIYSPLMKRVHRYIKSSSEIVFIDSSGNMDRHNSRIFILLCPTAVGALPLGIIITYSESEEDIFKGLELFKNIINDYSFFATLCPKIIITDDSTAERQALRRSFPKAKLLLCEFHVLQSVMRYLWDENMQFTKMTDPTFTNCLTN